MLLKVNLGYAKMGNKLLKNFEYNFAILIFILEIQDEKEVIFDILSLH